ncbi:MAG TPA: DUF190 domain-containing protein [Ktedonobacterales bacterium]|jgi:PII-like signaling protein
MPWIPGLSARILTHERARAGHGSVVEATLALARRVGLSARVTRAEEGWSAHGGARTISQVELSDDLPVVIELMGATEQVEGALPDLIALASAHGTITFTAARVFQE